MNKNKGFTLIELLVVIAIISLLSSIALASLSSARAKAADANIQGALTSLRSQAEIYFSTANHYGVLSNSSCTSYSAGSMFDQDTKIAAIITSALASSGLSANAKCRSGVDDFNFFGNATSWSVAIPLRTNTAQAWCVDSLGQSKQVTISTNATLGPVSCDNT